jgi:hypothetical protein
MLTCYLFIMDHWLKRGSLIKHGSTTTISSGITGVEGEYQHFMLPTSISSLGPAGSSTKQKYNGYYLSLGFTYTGDETASDALCVLCNKVLPNSSMLPAKLHKHHDTNHPEYRDKDISFIKHKLEALLKCQDLMVKS